MGSFSFSLALAFSFSPKTEEEGLEEMAVGPTSVVEEGGEDGLVFSVSSVLGLFCWVVVVVIVVCVLSTVLSSDLLGDVAIEDDGEVVLSFDFPDVTAVEFPVSPSSFSSLDIPCLDNFLSMELLK